MLQVEIADWIYLLINWQERVLIRGRVATLVSTVGQNNPG
jgi:hypothetical protein